MDEQTDINAAGADRQLCTGFGVKAVHRFLYLSGAGSLADDLTAETFVRAFRAMPVRQVRGVQFPLMAAPDCDECAD